MVLEITIFTKESGSGTGAGVVLYAMCLQQSIQEGGQLTSQVDLQSSPLWLLSTITTHNKGQCIDYRSPVELLNCSTLVCAECCCQWIRVSESLSCPCCYCDHLCYHDSIRPAHQIALTVLESLQATCKQCKQRVSLKTTKLTLRVCASYTYHHRNLTKCFKDQEVLHTHLLRKGYCLS